MARRNLNLANNPLLSGPALSDRASGAIPYREVKLSKIDRDPNQPRVHFDKDKLEELANSIGVYGILSPLIVKEGKKAGRFQVIAGERRLRAARIAGLESVPVIISKEEHGSGEDILAVQLVENLQRDDLTSLERAHAIGALKESFGLSIRQVGEKLGISKGMVQRSLEILDLPDDLLNALREGASESKILLLAKIEDEEIRASYLKDLDTLTRNKLRSDLKEPADGSGKSSRERVLSAEDDRVVDEIQRSIGLKVKMVRSSSSPESGRLLIDFYSDEDLQVLFRKLVADG